MKTILNSTSKGKSILKLCEEEVEKLDAGQQEDLVKTVISFYLGHDLKMGVDECQRITDLIIEMFPSENKFSYFIPKSGPNDCNRGRLYTKYNNELKAARKRNSTSLKSKRGTKKVKKL